MLVGIVSLPVQELVNKIVCVTVCILLSLHELGGIVVVSLVAGSLWAQHPELLKVREQLGSD